MPTGADPPAPSKAFGLSKPEDKNQNGFRERGRIRELAVRVWRPCKQLALKNTRTAKNQWHAIQNQDLPRLQKGRKMICDFLLFRLPVVFCLDFTK